MFLDWSSAIIMSMEILFAIVLFLQFGYIVYSDFQNRKERDSLTLKVMSKDLSEYKSALEKGGEDSPEEESDPYVTMEEAGIDGVLEAREI